MKSQPKLDLYKLHKAEYVATRKPVLVELKPASYLAVSGQGAPGGDLFTASIGALYGMAFTIKMTRKFAGQQDYAVCKLEGQWWSELAGFHQGRRPPPVRRRAAQTGQRGGR